MGHHWRQRLSNKLQAYHLCGKMKSFLSRPGRWALNYNILQGLMQVALAWGIGVTLSIDGQIEWTNHSMTFLELLHGAFKKQNAEIGHVKLVVRSNGGECMMNLTRLEGGIERRGENVLAGARANQILNVRVQMSSEGLEKIVRTTFGMVDEGISTDIRTLRCLMPGMPNPTYRFMHTV
jgi:hypothetical protein